jgi:hypothetical protein
MWLQVAAVACSVAPLPLMALNTGVTATPVGSDPKHAPYCMPMWHPALNPLNISCGCSPGLQLTC